jgi:fucose 4-O-acetylase-like acetyltransferase
MIKKLLTLSGLAIIGVLLFHAAGWGFTAMFAWTDRYMPPGTPNTAQFGTPAYYALRVIEQLIVFVIPAFLFVSGYFIAIATGRNQATVSWNVVLSRIRVLLIPYVIWTVALWVLRAVEGKTLSIADYALALATGSTNPAYYYVPLLVSLYLLSPLLVQWAKTHPGWLLLGTALLQTLVQLLYYPALLGIDMGTWQPYVDIVPKWFFPARIFWFALGIVVCFHLPKFKGRLERYRWPLLILVFVFFVIGIFEWEAIVARSGQPWLGHRETLIDTLYGLAVLLCFVAFDTIYRPFADTMSKLSNRSFGIYIVHSPVMEVVARGLYHLAPFVLGYQLIFQPLLLLFGLGVPLMLMLLVERSPARGYYRYLFG